MDKEFLDLFSNSIPFNGDGEVDFDQLNSLERDEYLRMLTIVQGSQVTLEDFKKFVSNMRIAIDTSLVDEPEYIYSPILPFLKRSNPRTVELKARLKNFIIMERFLLKPDQAKAALDMYKKRLGKK